MPPYRFLIGFCLLALPAAAPTARAQDAIEQIIRKERITRGDRAIMEAEIDTRVGRLVRAAGASQRTDARERLSKPMASKNASPEGRRVYAEICAEKLAPVIEDPSLERAFDAAMVLRDLGHPACATALVGGLSSDHPAVRLMSARGIQEQHAALAGDAGACRRALRALGRAGRKETDENVLRVIYQAVDFTSDVKDFGYGDQSASALNEILEGRLRQLAEGSNDEYKDEYAAGVAARCFKAAAVNDRKRMARRLAGMLQHCVDRFLDPQTAPEYLDTLNAQIRDMDEAVRRMIQEGGGSPPRSQLRLSTRARIEQQKDDARKAVADLLRAVDGLPGS